MASNQNADGDQSIVWMAIIIISIIGGVYFLSPYARQFWLYLVQFESYLLLGTTFDDGLRAQAWAAIEWARNAHPEAISQTLYFDVRHHILRHGNHNYVFTVVLLVMSVMSYRRFQGYMGTPTVEGLITTERRVWPVLEFIYRVNPLAIWSELRGPGRYPVTPYTHACENEYLRNPDATSKKNRHFDVTQARSVLIEQLGDLFQGYQQMPLFDQVVITLVASHECQKRSEFNGWLREFSITLAELKEDKQDEVLRRITELVHPVMALLDGNDYDSALDQNLTKPLLARLIEEDSKAKSARAKDRYMARSSTLEVFDGMKGRHAYNTTLLAACLQNAKRRGKLPPGRMVFLKPWDRQLFLTVSMNPYYVANPSQRHKFVSGFVAETVGIYSHLQHEYYARRGLTKPYVDTGVFGLRDRLALQNIIEKESTEEALEHEPC